MTTAETSTSSRSLDDDRVHVVCIGGSTRPDSSTERALRIAATTAQHAGATTEFITGRDLILPIYDTETSQRAPHADRLLQALRRAEALIIASPGYHGTMSGMIKNVLDYVEDLRSDERVYLDGLAVGCIAVAYGWQATVSTLQNLRVAVHALRGWPTPLGATINASGRPFTDDGQRCSDDSAQFQLETVGRQVVEFAQLRRCAAGRTVSSQ